MSEPLLQQILSELQGVNKRLDSMDTRLTKLEAGQESIKEQVIKNTEKLVNLEIKVSEIDKRLIRVEEHLFGLTEQVTNISKRQDETERVVNVNSLDITKLRAYTH